jgi:pilus assembly protein Flp/PilA
VATEIASRRWAQRLETEIFDKEHKTMIKKFFQDETGLELSEYAVAAALVALAVITAFTTLGTNIGAKITNLAAKIGT